MSDETGIVRLEGVTLSCPNGVRVVEDVGGQPLTDDQAEFVKRFLAPPDDYPTWDWPK